MPFRSAANAAAFFAARGGRLGQAVSKLRLTKVLKSPAMLAKHRPYRRFVTGVDIGGGLAATGVFASWEAKRIRQANKERDEAVQKFKSSMGRLPVSKKDPARRKRVPRTRRK